MLPESKLNLRIVAIPVEQTLTYGLGSFHAFLAIFILIHLLITAGTGEDNRPHLLDLIDQCIGRFGSILSRNIVCTRAAEILRRVVDNGNMLAIGMESNPLGQKNRVDPYTVIFSSDLAPSVAEAYSWTQNLGLEALLFDMTPVQWMAPNSFNWDRWNHTTIV